MPLETPRLDDWSFETIVTEVRKRIPRYCPEWTDYNLSDPGVALVELFAWMTDIILYRLNRMPDKHYIKFMELIGMRLHEPEAARVPVTFWLSNPLSDPLIIQGLTEVATTRTESNPALIFSTDHDFEIRVPQLLYLLTSRGSQQRGRTFNEHDVKELDTHIPGSPGIAVFSGGSADPNNVPLPDDAFYLGFAEDLSHHILGVYVDVVRAKFEGSNPQSPPYVWETMGTEQDSIWIEAEIDIDETKGLNESGWMRVHLPAMQRGERDNKIAYWVRCRLSEEVAAMTYRESPVVRSLSTASWGCTIPTTNVAVVENEFLGRSDGSPGQLFYLRNTPVVRRRPGEQLLIRYEDIGNDEAVHKTYEEVWEEVNDFADSTPESPHYMLDSITGEVRLGPALRQRDGSVTCYGRIPPKNAVLMMVAYRYGGGQIGNVSGRAINVNKSGIPYIEKIRNRFSAYGGLDAEQLEELKLRVPGYLRSMGRTTVDDAVHSVGRAVTAADFEYLAREEAGRGHIGRAHCHLPPDQPGLIRLLLIPLIKDPQSQFAPESLKLKDEICDAIKMYLDNHRLLCTRLEVDEPEYLWVSTVVRIIVGSSVHPDRARRRVEKKLYAFLNPLIGGHEGKGWPFGRELSVEEIQAVLYSVPGVQSIVSVDLYQMQLGDGQHVSPSRVKRQRIPLAADQLIVSFQHDVLFE